jgi:integrase
VRPLGSRKLRELTVNEVAAWSQANECALTPTTAVIALTALNLICRFALRRGWCRIGEALGLCWADVDFEAGLIRVHRQLSRKRVHRRLKTAAAPREVVLAPSVVTLLRERWLASPFKGAGAIVFCNTIGRGLAYRDVGEGFRVALRRVGLAGGTARLSLHSLRHGFASLLIAKGLNVVFVSRQLGHANPTVTLSTYAHLFERADHAATAREALEAGYAAINNAGG